MLKMHIDLKGKNANYETQDVTAFGLLEYWYFKRQFLRWWGGVVFRHHLPKSYQYNFISLRVFLGIEGQDYKSPVKKSSLK